VGLSRLAALWQHQSMLETILGGGVIMTYPHDLPPDSGKADKLQ